MLDKLRTLYRSLTGDRDKAKLDFRKTYVELVRSLKKDHSYEQAMHLAVGGEFNAMGIIERELLLQFGLKEDGYVIDVGCGSGRLAKPLSQYLTGKYLGIDVVPELVNYARQLVKRPDWRFEVAEGLRIPEADGSANMVCFFSVFTHLLHEQSYIYLQEARRVLKPNGKIVFSFIEFSNPGHWIQFEMGIKNMNTSRRPLNMFISRDAIEVWAGHLDLRIETILDGDRPQVDLPHPIKFEDGSVVEDKATLGQAVCVLTL